MVAAAIILRWVRSTPATAALVARPDDYEVDADDGIDRPDGLLDGVPRHPDLHALR
jgi:hypothetical protein